jgi:hypothetical protein
MSRLRQSLYSIKTENYRGNPNNTIFLRTFFYKREIMLEWGWKQEREKLLVLDTACHPEHQAQIKFMPSSDSV